MQTLRHLAPIAALAALPFVGNGQSAEIREPLGQSSRLTSLVISEIMFDPAGRTDERLEFVELFNSLETPEDISGYRLAGDISYMFPAGAVVPGRGYLVVARTPADLQATYSLGDAFGPFEGNLPNDEGTVRLLHRTGAIFLEAEYDARAPSAAAGAGHSLTLARPSFGESDPRAWSASHSIGGSPGTGEIQAFHLAEAVVINEFLANSDEPEVDYLELYNRGPNAIDLAGCALSDDPDRDTYIFPPNSVIPANGFLVLSETELGFALASGGETVLFKSPPRTRVLDSVRFGGQETGVSMGRVPDGGPEFYRLREKTPGERNGAMLVSDVVIHELMYHPISEDDDDQFIEIHNRGGSGVDLGGWRLEDGIDFIFPAGTILPAGGYLAVARDMARLRANHPNLTEQNSIGNFAGRLSRSGERVALTRPEADAIQVAVDEVTYRDGGRWGTWSDGGGSSLERVDARADSRQPGNWADSDETAKAPWTMVSRTGRVDLGSSPADQLQMLLQGAGECLIDDVEVLNASGANLVPNSTFEVSASGWGAEGTQDQSGWETGEGYNSARSYHVRAVERGDNQLNRIRANLTQALPVNSTATIRAKVRWLRGHPELLLRLRGNWLDVPAIMTLPTNLGTPGARNSRALENAGPAIFDLAHVPILPAAKEPVTVTVRIYDLDGTASPALHYRLDPSTSPNTVSLRDDGTAGDEVASDGVYSARIPGQSSASLVAYHVTAADSRGANSRFPSDGDHLVRYGESTPSGTFPVYRIWMTAQTLARWASRAKLDNTPVPVTFVLGNHRVIQGATALYAGSPYISPGYDSPIGRRCGYTLEFPADDRFLGDTALVLDWPGGHGNEQTALQEQMGYWIADRMNLPFSHRYYIRLHINGVTDMQRGTVFEAVNQPARDFLEAWLPNSDVIDFYKIDRAFEFGDGGNRIADPMPRLENYTTGGGAKKTERYRWTFLKRAYDRANDFTNIFNLVDALNAPAPEDYTLLTEGLIDLEEWMSILAVEHIIGNFDAYGHEIGKNMYAAKPDDGKWQLYMFDLDWLMLAGLNYSSRYAASSAPLFNVDDPTIVRMYNHPPFRRAYFRAIKKALEGPFQPELYRAAMDAKYASLVANGITMCDGQPLVAPSAVKTWFDQRRVFLQNQLDAVSAPFEITTNSGEPFQSDAAQVTLTGRAPVQVKGIRVNGIEHPVTWTSIDEWSLSVPLASGENSLTLEAVDPAGAVLAFSDSIAVTSTVEPIIVQANLAGGLFALSWNSQPGRRYQLGFKQSLSAGSWTSGPEIAAAGETTTLTVPINSSHGFYRILELAL